MKCCLLKHPLLRAYCSFLRIFVLRAFPNYSATSLFDSHGKYYCGNTGYIIASSDKYLLGILNSSLMTFYYGNISSRYRGDYLRFIYQYLEKLPILTIDFSNLKDKNRHNRTVELAEQMLVLHERMAKTTTETDKAMLQRQIDATDQEIDNSVYELYELTPEEIVIVEGSSK